MSDVIKMDVDDPEVAPVMSSGPRDRSDDGAGTVRDVIEVLDERLDVSKRQIVSGKVRVSTRTDIYDQFAEITLDRSTVEVSRVPIGRVVDVMPADRVDGDITIIPVIEERFVVVKQLYLKEELHIRRQATQDVSRVPVQLRRQIATVERWDANGRAVEGTDGN